MSQMSFSYFISYYFKNKNEHGISNIIIIGDEELDSYQVVNDYECDIKEMENLDEVKIIDWKRLK